MTKARDIKAMLGEQDLDGSERKVLETLAEKLDESLAAPIPARPEFQAQLRRQLLTQARRSLTPWYKRPSVWGSGMGVAAAAIMLAVGLQLYRPEAPLTPSLQAPVNPTPTEGILRLVSEDHLPRVEFPDELLPPGQPVTPESVENLELSQGLKVYRLTARPDSALFGTLATGLGLGGSPQAEGGGWQLTQGPMNLSMTADGAVTYINQDRMGQGRITAGDAAALARSFLESAALPIPSSQATTLPADFGGGIRGFVVTMTPRLEGRPVVNGQTVVRITEQGQVIRLDTFVQSGTELVHSYKAITQASAMAAAQARGGNFRQADLVFARNTEEPTVYMQPYWRVFGTNAQGAQVLRYVPALSR